MLCLFKYLDVWSHAWKVCMIRNENLLISRRHLISLKGASLKRSFFQRPPPLPEEQAPVSQQSLSQPTDLEVNLAQMPYPCWYGKGWYGILKVLIFGSHTENGKEWMNQGFWPTRKAGSRKSRKRMTTRFKWWGMVIETLQGGSREGGSSGNLKGLSSSYG